MVFTPKRFVSLYLVLTVFTRKNEGCSGVRNLPLRMDRPNYRIDTGNKDYDETNVNKLAARLNIDIRGLALKYLVEVAENAIYAEENIENTFNFCIYGTKAALRQFEIITKRKGTTINIKWRIADVTVIFHAQKEITIHARRRRSWWRRRSGCHKYKAQRGVTKVEVAKIKNTLTKVANSRGISYSRRRRFAKRRMKRFREPSQTQCPLVNPYVKPPIWTKPTLCTSKWHPGCVGPNRYRRTNRKNTPVREKIY